MECSHIYKNIPGVYQFSIGNESYIGSTTNLFIRCITQHKNNALTNTPKHNKFYSKVLKNSWNAFKYIRSNS